MIVLPQTRGVLHAGGSGVTWNPSDKGLGAALSNGNLTFENNGVSNAGWARATLGRSSGKHYYEVHIDVDGSTVQAPQVGVQLAGSVNGTVKIGAGAGLGWSLQTSSSFTWDNGTSLVVSPAANYTLNDVLGIAVDLDAGKIWWAVNNTWIASGNPGAGTNPRYSNLGGGSPVTLYPAISDPQVSSPGSYTVRFKTSSLTYAAPSGFSSWQGA